MISLINIASEYSFLNSSCRIKNLVERAKELKVPALGIADCKTLYGAYKFYNACIENNIRPLIGVQLEIKVGDYCDYLNAYALGKKGYYFINSLSSLLKLKDQPLRLEDIVKNSDDVVFVTSGDESLLYRFLIENKKDKFIELANFYVKNLKNFYIGLSTRTRYYSEISLKLDQFCLYNHLKSVLCNRVNYIRKEDELVYEALRKIKTPEFVPQEADFNSYLGYEDNSYFKSSNGTLEEILNKCSFKFEGLVGQLPVYDSKKDSKKFLYELGLTGLKKRLKTSRSADDNTYLERFNYEYNIITQMGFTDYFLIVYDFIKYAKTHDILVGFGRGSACSSLLAYALGIHNVDPIKYNLLFERFISLERKEMPDIDIDIDAEKRGDLIDYVRYRYGGMNVANCTAYDTFQIKSAIDELNKIFKFEPLMISSIKEVFSKKENSDKKFLDICKEDAKLQQIYSSYPKVKEMLYLCEKLIGLPQKVSTHASAIIISSCHLNYFTGLLKCGEKYVQTQFDAKDLEKLGLLKMDFLNLNYLTTIRKVINLIKEREPNFILPTDENDKKTYEMLQKGLSLGLFQIEGFAFTEFIKKSKVSKFDDLIQTIALNRPGPMNQIPEFLSCKFNPSKITYLHPDLEPILKDTYGIIVYQEQIMLIARKFANYTLGNAYVLIKAISKKKKDIMEKEKESFISNAIKNGYEENIVKQIFDRIESFAEYGFNKTHSVGYSKFLYLTAYLKANYPAEYLSVILKNTSDKNTYVALLREARVLGVTIMSPSISFSTDEFRVAKGKILLPLSAIKLITHDIAKQISELNQQEQFKSFDDFVLRTVDIITFDQFKNIVYSSALDEFRLSKKDMIENYNNVVLSEEYSFIPGLGKRNYSNIEYSYAELTNFELNALGFNLKYEFIVQYRNLYLQDNLVTIEKAKLGKEVKTLGIIIKKREHKDKSGKTMCFFDLSDNQDLIPCTVFSKLYSQLNNVNVGSIVEVCGKIDNERNLCLLVDKIDIIK